MSDESLWKFKSRNSTAYSKIRNSKFIIWFSPIDWERLHLKELILICQIENGFEWNQIEMDYNNFQL